MSENKLYGLDLLKELTLAFAPSGCEGNVADIIKEQISEYVDEIITDKLNNVIAKVSGNGKSNKRLMISAHMDEVGFMVTHIDDDGYIHFGNIGSIDQRVLCGKKVTLGNEDKKINGIISSKAIHLQSSEERKEATPVDKMYIDIGAKSKEEAEKYIQKGDFGTFDSEFIFYGDNMIKAKAIDDRFGCSVMCDIIRKMKAEKISVDYDIYFAFTVREEVGLSGAIPAAFRISCDKAIVLEATAIYDIVDIPAQSKVALAGDGGVISLIDNGTIYDIDFVNFAFETAKKYDIKCQVKKYLSGGNDASHIQKNKEGVKILAISAPCRYLHTSCNVINKNDYIAISDLVYSLINDIDIEF